ncbi:MAG: HD-GYP domain-containing protein [Phycisphaerales bacterium]
MTPAILAEIQRPMLLCSTAELEPGMTVGASLLHPVRPEIELISSRTVLTSKMIQQLERIGIASVWVEFNGTEELDATVATGLTLSQQKVYTQLKKSFAVAARSTISTAQIQAFRQTVMSLVTETIAGAAYAGLAYRLQTTDSPLFVHCSSVAYLSITIGHALQSYIVAERPRLNTRDAADLVPLGLGAMLHDIGKLALPEQHRSVHECDSPSSLAIDGYADHTIRGYKVLSATNASASARQTVLMHHQRWDGTGWPDSDTIGLRADARPLRGKNLHIFSRIVAAANVLDGMLNPRDADPPRRHPCQALARIASREFDGWFDPMVRRTILQVIPPFAVGERVTLTDGRPAAVVAPNHEYPCLPIVRPLVDNPDFRTEALTPDKPLRIGKVGSVDTAALYYEVPRMPTIAELQTPDAGDAGASEGAHAA